MFAVSETRMPAIPLSTLPPLASASPLPSQPPTAIGSEQGLLQRVYSWFSTKTFRSVRDISIKSSVQSSRRYIPLHSVENEASEKGSRKGSEHDEDVSGVSPHVSEKDPSSPSAIEALHLVDDTLTEDSLLELLSTTSALEGSPSLSAKDSRPLPHTSFTLIMDCFRNQEGKILLLVSAVLYSFVAMAVKFCFRFIPPVIVVFCQSISYIVYATFATFFIYGTNPVGQSTRHVRTLLICRGLSGSTGFFLYYFSMERLPIGDATAIYFTSPFYTALLSYFWTKDAFTKREIIAGLLGFIGVFTIARPEFVFGLHENSSLPEAVSMPHFWNRNLALSAVTLGAFVGSISLILIRNIGDRVNPAVSSFYFGAWASAVSFIMLLISLWSSNKSLFFANIPWYYWICSILIGLLSFLAQISLSKALQTESALRAAITRNLDIVLAYIYQVAIFNDEFSLWSLLGSILIITTTVYLLFSR
ncbi:putative Solute carrier family 35 member G1 [Cardiosporidium cionae]|uniref:Solute carrier family 35 member G1 n=1 Tax=Cardiosporidium cionae TaxID=476202 RepID=A0ABQ7J9L0_9APIC|nr:putative Solute carrier family 35 member G1 [Cardiosporidium cionae]|eukprot:KAF8820639.1 putative Solute carrier family 35 member G1 [Cardiosporidium cionae]